MPLTLLHIAPTTASRSPSPARAGEAWLRSVFSQNHAILASPAERAQRADGGAHAARGFVGGATAANNGLQNRAVSSKILLMKQTKGDSA